METSPPIWPQNEAFYIEGMSFHSRQACASIEILSDLIDILNGAQNAGNVPEFDTSAALDHVQNIVFRAAAISRYFWPSRKRFESRGTYLRRAFLVTDASPLRNRALRDAAEHFDERLDDYLQQGIVERIIPEWFGLQAQSEVPTRYFRAYFINSGSLRILNHEFFVQPIADDVVRIHNLLVEFENSGGRFT